MLGVMLGAADHADLRAGVGHLLRPASWPATGRGAGRVRRAPFPVPSTPPAFRLAMRQSSPAPGPSPAGSGAAPANAGDRLALPAGERQGRTGGRVGQGLLP